MLTRGENNTSVNRAVEASLVLSQLIQTGDWKIKTIHHHFWLSATPGFHGANGPEPSIYHKAYMLLHLNKKKKESSGFLVSSISGTMDNIVS